MKLAEALQRRSDLNASISDLHTRIINNAMTQEGEKPAEDPYDLLKQLNASVDELSSLIADINKTNCVTNVNGMSLTEIIAQKDALKLRLSNYRDFADAANQNTYRARNTEIRILPSMDVKQLRAEADRISKKIRELDNLLQETNWTTELIQE